MDVVNYCEARGCSYWAHGQREWTDGSDEDVTFWHTEYPTASILVQLHRQGHAGHA